VIDRADFWRDQCQAALRIKIEFGIEKALGYLIGEKLVAFVRDSDRNDRVRAVLPEFVLEIKRIFNQFEIRAYLDNVKRIGSLAHVCTDEEYEVFRTAGAIDEDPVEGAEDVLIVERIKEMLLDR